MKVHIGNYPQLFGTMQLAQLLRFWDPKKPDQFGILTRSQKVQDLHDWLTWRRKGDELEATWLTRFLNWVHSKRKQTIRVRIDPWDTWSLDFNLAYIIAPALRQLKATQQGAGNVEDEDVPAELRSRAAPPPKDGWVDEHHFKRWDYVLDEMIWAFERLLKDDEPEDEDAERMRRGFALFGKYYLNLWD